MPDRKKDGTPLPDVIDPAETMQITLCIPKNRSYLSSFFGALYQLTMWNYWENNAAHDGQKVAAVWWRYWLSWDREMTELECEGNMATCCVEAPILRRDDPVTGRPQISVNGGTTWTPDPADPAFAIRKPSPPVPAGVVPSKCDAARNTYAGALQVVNDTSANIATASTVYELAVLIAGALLNVFFIVTTGGLATPLVNTITGIIWGAGTAAFELGQAGFDAYWTETVLDKLLCSFLDNIGDGGSWTESQYNAWREQFRFDTASSPARDLVLTAIGVGGANGLSLWAASFASTSGDCSECEDTCWAGWAVFTPEGASFPWGTIDSKVGDLMSCHTVDAGGGACRGIFYDPDDDNPHTMTWNIVTGGVYGCPAGTDVQDWLDNLGPLSVDPETIPCRAILFADGCPPASIALTCTG